jgi:hypothetical protein
MSHIRHSDSKVVEETADADTHRSDWSKAESVGTAVVCAIAGETGREPTELPVLSTAVDPDGLDQLLTHGNDSVRVSFRYAGCGVMVRGDGTVLVEQSATADPSGKPPE